MPVNARDFSPDAELEQKLLPPWGIVKFCGVFLVQRGDNSLAFTSRLRKPRIVAISWDSGEGKHHFGYAGSSCGKMLCLAAMAVKIPRWARS